MESLPKTISFASETNFPAQKSFVKGAIRV